MNFLIRHDDTRLGRVFNGEFCLAALAGNAANGAGEVLAREGLDCILGVESEGV